MGSLTLNEMKEVIIRHAKDCNVTNYDLVEEKVIWKKRNQTKISMVIDKAQWNPSKPFYVKITMHETWRGESEKVSVQDFYTPTENASCKIINSSETPVLEINVKSQDQMLKDLQKALPGNKKHASLHDDKFTSLPDDPDWSPGTKMIVYLSRIIEKLNKKVDDMESTIEKLIELVGKHVEQEG